MKSKSKLISALGSFALSALFVTAVSAQAQIPNSLYIYSPDTNTGTRVYYGPQMSVATSTTATSTATTTTVVSACVPLMTSFHRFGDYNGEVAKLQNFLEQWNGANLNGLGYYGPATVQEVRNLQYTYGLPVTGVQHEKTTALINNLICGNIAKRDRMVAPAGMVSGGVSVGSVNFIGGKNIYPNAGGGVVKDYGSPKGETVKNKATETPASSTSFFGNLSNDFQKIKENYKAYVLVLVLVIALFWFLRKAATE
jgi:peptidoglycan hydrolase-like protein with peptidoglycan-binding domain